MSLLIGGQDVCSLSCLLFMLLDIIWCELRRFGFVQQGKGASLAILYKLHAWQLEMISSIGHLHCLPSPPCTVVLVYLMVLWSPWTGAAQVLSGPMCFPPFLFFLIILLHKSFREIDLYSFMLISHCNYM